MGKNKNTPRSNSNKLSYYRSRVRDNPQPGRVDCDLIDAACVGTSRKKSGPCSDLIHEIKKTSM